MCSYAEPNQVFSNAAVVLIGGPGPQEGYLFALNPATKTYGPVCDDAFDLKSVRLRLC